jgi:hypothetical protein
MSLTSVLAANPDVRNSLPKLKPDLVTLGGVPMLPPDWKAAIAVPSVGKPHEAGEIGTAFDYLARAILTRKAGAKNVEARRPVAQEGLARLPEALRLNFANDLGPHAEQDPVVRQQRQEGLKLALAHESELLYYMRDRLDAAMSAQDEFVRGKVSMDEYARHTLFMARVDVVYRAASVGVVDEFLRWKVGKAFFAQRRTVADDGLLANVVQLGNAFTAFFSDVPMAHVWLNPIFPPYSQAIEGADADLIFDSTLLDIKSTADLGYKTTDWAQVLGYAAMARAVGIPVARAGIYFARVGLCAVIPFSPELLTFLPSYLDAILDAAGPIFRMTKR